MKPFPPTTVTHTAIVTRIVKEYTNGAMRMPVAWLELACGHAAAPSYTSGKQWTDDPHDESQHAIGPGTELPCERCDWYAEALAKIRTMPRGEFSHSRFRHNDSRGFGSGRFYVYGYDALSPTRVKLLFSVDGTKEAGEALSAVGASPLSPTERR